MPDPAPGPPTGEPSQDRDLSAEAAAASPYSSDTSDGSSLRRRGYPIAVHGARGDDAISVP